MELLVERARSIEDGLAKTLRHAVRGEDTVEWMIRERVIGHEAEHVAQIEELRGWLGLETPQSIGHSA
jgi:hypothetical protein